MAKSSDMGTTVNSRSGRRGNASSNKYLFDYNYYVRSEEDIQKAVNDDKYTDDYNELVVNSPNICGVYIPVYEKSGFYIYDKKNKSFKAVGDPYKAFPLDVRDWSVLASVNKRSEIAKKFNLPVYGLYEGKLYEFGPPVKGKIVEEKIGYSEEQTTLDTISLISEPVPFEKIINSKIKISSKVSEEVAERVPRRLFRKIENAA